jgi:glycosyltransferase involved in cell wall biosynthesis
MHETAHAFFHLDQPVNEATCPAGPLTLRGWVVGKDGRPVVDLRVKLGAATHPAVLGFPRPDLAAYFQRREPHLPGGFEAHLLLPPGRHELTFEAGDIGGQWRTVGSVALTGRAGSGFAPSAALAVVQPHEFARALQLALRWVARQPVAEVATTIAAEIPVPQVTRYPHQPFHGHLHQPALLERTLFGRLHVEGWLFHETQEIRRVFATVDLQAWQTLEHRGELAYVAALHPQHPQAAACQISGLIDVPAQLPSPLSVRIYAELADGSLHLCQVQRTTVSDGEQEKAPFARFSRVTFARTGQLLLRACRRRGLTVTLDRSLWRGIHGVYTEYRDRAPRRSERPVFTAAPVSAATSTPPRRITLVTHNLNREGAPLFLLEFARHLADRGIALQVIAAAEGPLWAEYEQFGARVDLADLRNLRVARHPRELEAALRRLAGAVDLRETGLVIANTLSTWWGVHLAHRAGRPSLFSIHESTTPASFYLGQLAPALLPTIERTFSLATHVSFLTEATRQYYHPVLRRANHSLNPGWIDLRQIDYFLSAHPRSALRRQLDLPDQTPLVINVGTVCDRKGQHIFARAVDLLWRQQPALAASTRFLMIGGRDTLFDRAMQDLLAQLARPNLQIVAETDAPLAYYGAADGFVCSSYEESFPRVVLEAMACRLPILSTQVHGIPEMIRANLDGLLVAPGDTAALADGLARMLADPAAAQARAARARARLEENFTAERLLPRHAELAIGLAARPG